MGVEKCKREIGYPYIENADEKLKELCEKGLDARYSGKKKERAMARLNEELEIIRRQRSASGYLTLLDVLEAVMFEPGDICIRGTDASSLVVYVTGLSTIEPLESKPALYPEFYFGIDGERLPAFEMSVAPNLYDKLLEYYENYSGELHMVYRCDEEFHFLRVFMGEFEEQDIDDNRYYHRGIFRFLFTKMGERNRQSSDFAKGAILEACRPETFSDYVKCYGLVHGTDVWEENAESLIKSGTVTFKSVIADREDVYEFLLQHGFDKRAAFVMAESVRKGQINKNGWNSEQLEAMREKEVPEWFIESCSKIKYLFPRAHAMVYLRNYCNMAP